MSSIAVQEGAERRAAHATELRKKAAEADARLKRLYEAIESSVADIEDKSLKERIAELRALKSQAQVDAERATIALDAVGVEITPTSFARLPTRCAKGYAVLTAETAAITSARWPSGWRERMAKSGSLDREVTCCAH